MMMTAQVVCENRRTVEIRVLSHTALSVAGTKRIVMSQSGGSHLRCTSPITTARMRYIVEAAATAPPGLNAKPLEPASSRRTSRR